MRVLPRRRAARGLRRGVRPLRRGRRVPHPGPLAVRGRAPGPRGGDRLHRHGARRVPRPRRVRRGRRRARERRSASPSWWSSASRATARSSRSRGANVYRVRGEEIVEIWIFEGDQEAARRAHGRRIAHSFASIAWSRRVTHSPLHQSASTRRPSSRKPRRSKRRCTAALRSSVSACTRWIARRSKSSSTSAAHRLRREAAALAGGRERDPDLRRRELVRVHAGGAVAVEPAVDAVDGGDLHPLPRRAELHALLRREQLTRVVHRPARVPRLEAGDVRVAAVGDEARRGRPPGAAGAAGAR